MSLRRYRDSLQRGFSPKDAAIQSVYWKKDIEAPDYDAMADATEYSVDMMENMANLQLAETRRQYEDMAPIMKQVADTQIAAMGQQMEQGRDYYDHWKNNFRPVEQSLVDDVNNYNSDAEREKMASMAGADVEQQAKIQREISAREMASMGINPNSLRYQDQARKSGLTVAAVKAGTMTAARDRAKELGYAKKLDAVGIGRGLTGASTGAYGGAVSAGSSAGNTTLQPANYVLNGMSTAANTMGNAASLNVNGAQTILNSQSNLYGQKMQSQSEMLGTGLGAAAAWAKI